MTARKSNSGIDIMLTEPATIADKAHEAGDTVTVDKATADWLIGRKVAEKVEKAQPKTSPK